MLTSNLYVAVLAVSVALARAADSQEEDDRTRKVKIVAPLISLFIMGVLVFAVYKYKRNQHLKWASKPKFTQAHHQSAHTVYSTPAPMMVPQYDVGAYAATGGAYGAPMGAGYGTQMAPGYGAPTATAYGAPVNTYMVAPSGPVYAGHPVQYSAQPTYQDSANASGQGPYVLTAPTGK